MGYELTRFTHAIDEEFVCSICTMIFKDPMQTPCEHIFCNECIKGWLVVDQSCPIERKPLQFEDLNPALRIVRNVVNKFEIKCDFESKGCAAIVKLENLEDHVARCEYNPIAKDICDNCVIERRRLADQAVRQRKNSKLNDNVVRLNDDLNQFRRQEDEFLKLNDEICSLRSQIKHFQNEIILKEESSKRNNEISNATNHLVKQPEFRVWSSMKILIKQLNVLEVDNDWGYAQSIYPLDQNKFSYQIEILNLGEYIGIGLRSVCQLDRVPSFDDSSISYFSDGSFFIDSKWENFGLKCNVGDIIECGINFPSDYVNDGRRVLVYFNRNGKLIRVTLVAMPIFGFFLTVSMGKGSKIRYFRN